MKVLVTGAAGFIGSNFLYLLSEVRPEWKVTALDLLTYAGNYRTIAPLIDEHKAVFERVDITDFESVTKLFARDQYDLVFHFAAESHVDRSIESAAAFVKTNVLGTQNLVDAARRFAVKRFIHISTDEVYGSLGETGRFLETTPLDPSSPYSASKASSDLLVLAAHKTHGFPAMVTRCTNNYGPYQFPEKFIPLFVTNAMEDRSLPLYGDGMNVRSWIHVKDHNEAVLCIAEKGRVGEIYNIGGMAEAELPNRIVAETIVKALGKSPSLIQYVTDRLGHDRRYAVDANKLLSELGWKPRIPFSEGLLETITWYANNQSWWREIKSGEYAAYYERMYSHRS
jgi:dTDP-glucose 4,6-dehydratase